jgi:hypothetical protein
MGTDSLNSTFVSPGSGESCSLFCAQHWKRLATALYCHLYWHFAVLKLTSYSNITVRLHDLLTVLLDNLCNDNQLRAQFILNLFHQSTSTCFGHVYCPSSGGIHCTFTAGWVRMQFHPDPASSQSPTHTARTNCSPNTFSQQKTHHLVHIWQGSVAISRPHEVGFKTRYIRTRIRLACARRLEFGRGNLPEIKQGTVINKCLPSGSSQGGAFTCRMSSGRAVNVMDHKLVCWGRTTNFCTKKHIKKYFKYDQPRGLVVSISDYWAWGPCSTMGIFPW